MNNNLDTRLLDGFVRLQEKAIEQLLADEKYKEAGSLMKGFGISKKDIKEIIKEEKKIEKLKKDKIEISNQLKSLFTDGEKEFNDR